MTTPPDTLTRPPMSERQFQDSVVDLARWLGYRVYHTHDSRHSAAGFPDLTLLRARPGEPPRLVFAELKAATGALRDAQADWLADLDRLATFAAVLGQPALVGAYVWRPADWFDGTIDRILR